jgi:hypothetical protein
MKSTAEHWRELGSRLGIEVIAPCELELDGRRVGFTALLPQFGAPRGMVVDADYDVIEPHRSSLLAAGYGYSCCELRDNAGEDPPIEMLADWGWSGESPKPNWLPS